MGKAPRGAPRLRHAGGADAEGIAALKSPAAAGAERDSWLDALLSYRGVATFWILYGLAHGALRLSISRTLALDDARASELVQTLSPGYQLRQPPLYEWILWCAQQALGAGIESHLAVRYLLIALLGIATFGAARAAIKDERWAAVASLSLAFSYPVGWTFHEWATQTILLSIACMATLHAAIRFFETPGLRTAGALGLALALGIYAKFSFPLFAGGLLLAALASAELRKRFADLRLLLSLAIAAFCLAPFAYWISQTRGDVVADLSAHLVIGGQSHLERVAVGLGRLAVSIPIFLLPWIVFVAILAPPAFARGPQGAPPAAWAERLTLWTMILAAAIAAIGIAASGATNVGARYVHPILMVAPVYVFARVARLAPGAARLRSFAAFAVTVAAIVLGVRFVGATDNPLTRQASRGLLRPYSELARQLEARGITEGTLRSPAVRDAGNMRAFLPGLRVIAIESLRVVPPPQRAGDERSCVLLWQEDGEAAARQAAQGAFGTVERISVTGRAPWPIAREQGTWFIARLDPKSEACR